jgi:hypothetical protein
MNSASLRLNPYCSNQFVLKHPIGAPQGLNGPLLEGLYVGGFNGGYFWNRALLVRPAVGTNSVLSVDAWNEPELWKDLYDAECANTVFFAEDAFGVQFGVRRGRIVQFDPETAAMNDCAASLDEWVSLLIADPAYFTGAPVLAAWESQHAELRAGWRLLPRQLFMLGGEFHSANMVPKLDVEGMQIRAQFWKVTRDLPEGESIVFSVDG